MTLIIEKLTCLSDMMLFMPMLARWHSNTSSKMEPITIEQQGTMDGMLLTKL
jgi:hypothetical protein